jgi:cell division protein FtsB
MEKDLFRREKMRVVFMVVACLIALSCARKPEAIRDHIKFLIQEEKNLNVSVNALRSEFNNLNQQVGQLREEVKTLEHVKGGGDVEYLLKLELRQERAGMDALDLGAQMKDEWNAVEFEMSVDKRTFQKYNAGDNFLKEYRRGSAMTEGSHSSWVIKVIGKRTILL